MLAMFSLRHFVFLFRETMHHVNVANVCLLLLEVVIGKHLLLLFIYMIRQ